MIRILTSLALAASLLAAPMAVAQDAKAPAAKASAGPKVGKDQKVCRYKFPNASKATTWVCAKEQPCCAWDAITYVKCGSTITGCL